MGNLSSLEIYAAISPPGPCVVDEYVDTNDLTILRNGNVCGRSNLKIGELSTPVYTLASDEIVGPKRSPQHFNHELFLEPAKHHIEGVLLRVASVRQKSLVSKARPDQRPALDAQLVSQQFNY